MPLALGSVGGVSGTLALRLSALHFTFQVSKPSVLPQDREELGQPGPRGALHVLRAGLRGQLQPQGPAVRQEVELVEESRLVPGGQVAVGERDRWESEYVASVDPASRSHSPASWARSPITHPTFLRPREGPPTCPPRDTELGGSVLRHTCWGGGRRPRGTQAPARPSSCPEGTTHS